MNKGKNMILFKFHEHEKLCPPSITGTSFNTFLFTFKYLKMPQIHVEQKILSCHNTFIYKTMISMLMIAVCISGVFSQTSCDYELILVSSAMGNFNTKAYQPRIMDDLFSELNSLQASILATYQLCEGKIIIDPSSLYPQDKSECEMGLYNVSLLEAQYTGQSAKIRADIDKLGKIVFSTQNDCNPIINYRGWTNITSDCKDEAKDLDNTINQYLEEIMLGKGDGTKYIDEMLVKVEKLRKLCGFNVLVKPKVWKQDTCKAANQHSLYPIVDQIDTVIMRENWLNFTAYFYQLYQGVYRAHYQCISNATVSIEESRLPTQLQYE